MLEMTCGDGREKVRQEAMDQVFYRFTVPYKLDRKK